MLVMTTSSFASQVCRSRTPLLLPLRVPSLPITPDHVWWSVPTQALKSPTIGSFSDFETAAISSSMLSCLYW